MTVVCPSCDSKFRDPPADIPRTRPMQCGRCEHQWLLEPASDPRVKVDTPSIQPDMTDIIDNPDAIRTALPVITHEKPSEACEIVEADASPQPMYVDRAPQIAKKPPFNPARPILALACIAAIAGGVVFKDTVMAELPQTTPVYKAAGLATDNPDLEIANIVTTKSKKDGINQLIVKGEIQNIADNTVPIPPLKLTMRGESNANLYAWTVSAAKGSLKAGETSRFTAVAHDIPKDAVNVEVEFAPSAKE